MSIPNRLKNQIIPLFFLGKSQVAYAKRLKEPWAVCLDGLGCGHKISKGKKEASLAMGGPKAKLRLTANPLGICLTCL